MAVQESPVRTKKISTKNVALKVRITHSLVRTRLSKSRLNSWQGGWISGAVFWLVTFEIQRLF